MPFTANDPNIWRGGRNQSEKIITEAIKAEFEKPGVLQEFLKTLFEMVKNKNATIIVEMLNRIEGKVKDEIQVDVRLVQFIPDQQRQVEIIDRYKTIEIEAIPQEQEQLPADLGQEGDIINAGNCTESTR